jgi:hypothetical protein
MEGAFGLNLLVREVYKREYHPHEKTNEGQNTDEF